MSKRQIENELKEYARKYDKIPRTQEDRVTHILGKWATNEKVNNEILKKAKEIRRIKWHTIDFTMYKELKPSARPRANTRMGYIKMYVPHAAENGEWFEQFIIDNDIPIISTPCKVDITIYEKTPDSFSMRTKVLAELGLLQPWKRTGDVDNYTKSVLDMVQHGMLDDDCLIIEEHNTLMYSILPRVEVQFKYMDKFPKL